MSSPSTPLSPLSPSSSLQRPPSHPLAAAFFAFAGEMPSLHHPTKPPASIPLTATPLVRLVGGRLPSPPHTNSVKFPPFPPKIESFLQIRLKSALSVGLAAAWWRPVASMAAEAEALTEQASGKISFESIVLAVDDFINRYPFFFASVSAVWLIVIPLTQEYLKKYKFISAFDGYLKLRDDPSAQLLDIRNRKTLRLRAPDLRPLNKEVVYVEFSGDDDGFVKEVLGRFSDPGNTVLCVVDK